MSWKFKVSKYKNAAPKQLKREETITEVPIGNLTQSCGNYVSASCSHLAFNVEQGGTGNIGVLPLNTTGKIGQSLPLLKAHSDYVTDHAFSPFHDDILASCSADNTVKVWKLPEVERLSEEMPSLSASVKLPSQDRRVETLAWNPVADDVLAVGVAKSVKVFDVNTNTERYDLSVLEDQIFSLGWRSNGASLVTTSKDKKIRVLDPRSQSVVQEATGHQGIKDSRAVWLGDTDFIVSTGFSRSRHREVRLWDSRKFTNALACDERDQNNGTLMPLLDEDTNMLLLVGKADTSWYYMEVATAEPYFTANSVERTGSDQIRGACLIPKLAVNVMEGEVDRLVVLFQNSISPMPYIVPRRTYKDYHADLFPDTRCREPALTAEQWCSGENAQVALISLDPTKRPKANIPKPKDKEIISQVKKMDIASPTTPSNKPVFEVKPTVSTATKPSVVTSNINNNTAAVEKPPPPQAPTEPTKAQKTFAALHQSKCKYVKGVTEHVSTHIVNIRKLCRTLPGQSNLFYANDKRCAFPIEGSGGLVAVVELDKPGRLPDTGIPSIVQNGSKVNDFVFDPFDDCKLLVGCENAKVYIWNIPKDGLTETLTEYDSYLMSHTEKIYFMRFHPLAKDVVLTGSYDMTIKLWDLSDNSEQMELTGHTDEIFCAEWSPDGQYIATVCKDGKVRIYDPRKSTEPIKEGTGPVGPRGARVVWALNMKYLVVSGFDRSSNRTLSIYDAAMLGQPLTTESLDISTAILVTHYDEGTGTLFLIGRGEGCIYGYEISEEAPHLFPLESTKPEGLHQGMALMSKLKCNPRKVEIARAWRLTQTTIEPMSFTVPRVKTEYFQDDLFPDTLQTGSPVMSSAEWFRGENKKPVMVSLRPKDMKPLSEAPVEAPKVRKYDSYNPDTYKTDEQKKEELIAAMTNKLDKKDEPLWEADQEGVDEDEWDDY